MKPLSRIDDGSTLQELGKASIQIVHDLKNQLNGLKLYATFLRKRIEKSQRPEDEQQTVMKLIAGLDRAANDLSLIVQYARPIELKKQPGFDIQKAMRSICSRLNQNSSPIVCDSNVESLPGNLDPTRLSHTPVRVSVIREGSDQAKIEWSGFATIDHDPFRSFAGSDEIKMSLAAKIIEAHGGSVEHDHNRFLATLPLSSKAKAQ